MINTTTKYDSIIYDVSYRYGVNDSLIRAVIMKESSWDPNAYKIEINKIDMSQGLMQLLLSTAEWILKDPNITRNQLYNPSINIEAGTKYLAYQLKRYSGDIKKALAAYNAGSTKYTLAGTFINQGYVDRTWEYYQEYLKYLSTISYELPTPYITMENIDTTQAELPTPYITMENIDTTQAEIATADIIDTPPDDQSDVTELDDPNAISLPFDPFIGILILGGLVVGGGGYSIWGRGK